MMFLPVYTPSFASRLDCRSDVLFNGTNQTEHRNYTLSFITKAIEAYQNETRDGAFMSAIHNRPLTIAIQKHKAIQAQLEHTRRDAAVRFVVMEMTTDDDVICLELALMRRELDVVLPFDVDVEIKLASKHSVEILERYFSAGLMMTDGKTADFMHNKKVFTHWLVESGYADYVPRVFDDPKTVVFPAVVKPSSKGFGTGIAIVHTDTELRNAILALDMENSIVIEEAISSPIEPAVMFVAKSGKILGAACTLDHHNSTLFVAGKGEHSYPVFVECEHFERIGPILHVLLRIIRQVGYNGNGCINFKFKPLSINESALFESLAGIPLVQPGHAVPILKDFAALTSSDDAGSMKAVPKIFEINPRICGPVKTSDVLVDFARLYAGVE